MRIDFIANPEDAARYQVIDHETGEDIRHVAWADTDSGCYATFRLRKPNLAEKRGADLRRQNADGSFLLDEHDGDFSIIDTAENPLKNAFLMLLHDPEIIAELRDKIMPNGHDR